MNNSSILRAGTCVLLTLALVTISSGVTARTLNLKNLPAIKPISAQMSSLITIKVPIDFKNIMHDDLDVICMVYNSKDDRVGYGAKKIHVAGNINTTVNVQVFPVSDLGLEEASEYECAAADQNDASYILYTREDNPNYKTIPKKYRAKPGTNLKASTSGTIDWTPKLNLMN